MCAPSEDSDQPAHARSLIRIFTRRFLDSQGCKVSSRWQRRLWSDCADAQADLRFRWAHMSEGLLFFRFFVSFFFFFFMLRVELTCWNSRDEEIPLRNFKEVSWVMKSNIWNSMDEEPQWGRFKEESWVMKFNNLIIFPLIPYTTSVDSDRLAHKCSLIRVCTGR